jgi:hypothetical protein
MTQHLTELVFLLAVKRTQIWPMIEAVRQGYHKEGEILKKKRRGGMTRKNSQHLLSGFR